MCDAWSITCSPSTAHHLHTCGKHYPFLLSPRLVNPSTAGKIYGRLNGSCHNWLQKVVGSRTALSSPVPAGTSHRRLTILYRHWCSVLTCTCRCQPQVAQSCTGTEKANPIFRLHLLKPKWKPTAAVGNEMKRKWVIWEVSELQLVQRTKMDNNVKRGKRKLNLEHLSKPVE